MLLGLHPAIRFAVGLVVLVVGVALHKVIFDVAGAAVMVMSGALWLRRGRSQPR